jgi:hypothetical protein
MQIYICRNGDLGFFFDRPFRMGGSSRFLTITFLLVPKELSHLPKRIVRKMYRKKKKGGHAELKGVQLTHTEKSYFADKAGNLLDRHPAIRVFSITIEKKTIKDRIRGDSGRLYNHVSRLVLPDRIKNASLVTVIPYKRSIKAKDSVCLADDLQAELWFALKSNTVIENNPQEGLKSLNLRFVDWIGHIIWSKYEDNESEAYDMLKRRIEITPWWETLAGQ